MGPMRGACLNETAFRSLGHARPHTSLNGLTPSEFARRSNVVRNQNGLAL
jgi:putative transposase